MLDGHIFFTEKSSAFHCVKTEVSVASGNLCEVQGLAEGPEEGRRRRNYESPEDDEALACNASSVLRDGTDSGGVDDTKSVSVPRFERRGVNVQFDKLI